MKINFLIHNSNILINNVKIDPKDDQQLEVAAEILSKIKEKKEGWSRQKPYTVQTRSKQRSSENIKCTPCGLQLSKIQKNSKIHSSWNREIGKFILTQIKK